MKSPARRKALPSRPASPKAGLARAAVIGASAGYVTARLIDIALVSTGVAAAVGSAGFAGYMLVQGDHPPQVNGMQYLAIFAQPSSGPKRPAPGSSSPPAPAAPQVAQAPAIDTAPLGAIDASQRRAAPEYELVAAARDHAWVRSGARILSVRPGDTIPDLGKVSEIAWREGQWILIGEDGKPILDDDGRARVSKPLIVGGQAAR